MRITPILFFSAVAVSGYFVWQHFAAAPAKPKETPAIEVGIVTLAPQSMRPTHELPGRTAPYKIAEIRPQVGGIIKKKLFTEGSDVKEGAPLYHIDPAPYQAALDSAEAELQKAQANVASAQAKAGRYKELVLIGGVSKQEDDDARADLQQRIADVAIARANLTRAKINVEYTNVLAPISGRISASSVTEGALVNASQTEPLATIQQLDPIYVDVTQPASELGKLRRILGDDAHETTATLLLDGDTKPIETRGVVQFSDVTVDPTTGAVRVRLLFDNPDRYLLPGLFVRALLSAAQEEEVLLVPQRAVVRDDAGKAQVWLVDAAQKVALQPITLGKAQGSDFIVESGLSAGDRVVVEGLQKMKPNVVVSAIEKQ